MLVAAITPLCDSGERLDEDAFAPLLDFYSAGGADGLFLLGTTGEGFLLRAEERRRALELAVAGARGLRVLAHCGAQSTAETTALATHAAETGADGIAVVGPPYFPLSDEELLEHFAAAAAACAPAPFYVYEYADRSGYAIPIAVIDRLRERAPNLTGMKVSDSPFEHVEPYIRTGLDIFVGAEGLVPKGLTRGAVGAVSGVAAAFPEAVSALVEDPAPVRTELVESLRAVLTEHSLQASAKAALGLRGLPVRADTRAPLRPLDAEATQALRGGLERLVGADALAPSVGV
jgi:dihydrodipicolinate synthase/N-acetylneuraminate lyase